MSKDVTDVTGLAVALTATAKARANQLSRDLQAASRRHDRAGDALAEARRAYARAAADEYRALYDQALGTWTAAELAAAGAKPPPPTPAKPPTGPRAQ